MKRILIQNGTLYDGLGGQPYQADLLVQDDRIAQIAPGITEPADQVIDATGKAVTPGFVDIHRHHDAKPLNDPHFGEVELAQGITTAVAGNCGISMTPRPESDEAAKEYYSFEEAVMGPIGLDGPHTYRDYLAALHKADLPLNVAAMIGTGTVKICVKGFADTPYTQQELDDARALIEDAMAAGAPGVSLGIMYLPECYSSTDEFAYILEPVGRYHRVITTHIRGEGDSMVQSVREVIEIARRVGCALEISHFKSCGMKNWGKDIHTAIADIEAARAEGMDVTVDFYPSEGGSTALTTTPLALMIAGGMLARSDLKKLVTNPMVWLITALRCVVFPLGFLAALYFLPLDRTLCMAILILASCPAGSLTAVLAKQYDTEGELASQAVAHSTLSILISVPLVLSLGSTLLGI